MTNRLQPGWFLGVLSLLLYLQAVAYEPLHVVLGHHAHSAVVHPANGADTCHAAEPSHSAHGEQAPHHAWDHCLLLLAHSSGKFFAGPVELSPPSVAPERALNVCGVLPRQLEFPPGLRLTISWQPRAPPLA